MSAHTPGPWALRKEWEHSDYALDVFSESEPCEPGYRTISICLVEDFKDEAEANARLIAAAPDLLAALKSLLLESDRMEASADDSAAFMEAVECHQDAKLDARAAIAKAEGRAS